MTLPTAIRLPAVAGSFYPREAATLKHDVDALLAGAKPEVKGRLRAMVVPHAGYVYSGPVAASAYALLAGQPRPRRVLLLGPAHHVPLRGMALPEARAFATPLGEIPLDAAGVDTATKQGVGWSADAHLKEHSLEVQLPFLQRVLGEGFTLIPVVVGRAHADDVAAVIDALADDDTLVLVSSDLSHFLPWAAARDVDGQTAQQILAYDYESLDGDQACGAYPMRGLLLWARNKGLTVRQLDLRNSGDTAGDRGRVVGYGAFAFEEPRWA